MGSSVQPSQILHAIRRNLVACLVILLVCTLAGFGVALSTKPVAAATTTLGIQPKSKETPSFSTQAKDLMPTLVELSTSPKVLDPAAKSLNMKTSDLSDALTVTNPPETLVLSITAKASSKEKAVNIAKATAASLNKELSSGDLLGKEALGMTTSTTSPATTATTTIERPGARASAISGLLLGLLASVSYAMFRHRRSSARRRGTHRAGSGLPAGPASEDGRPPAAEPVPGPASGAGSIPVPAASGPVAGSVLAGGLLHPVRRAGPGARRPRSPAHPRLDAVARLGTHDVGGVVELGSGAGVPADGVLRRRPGLLRAAGTGSDDRDARGLRSSVLPGTGAALRAGGGVPRSRANAVLDLLGVVDEVCGPHEPGGSATSVTSAVSLSSTSAASAPAHTPAHGSFTSGITSAMHRQQAASAPEAAPSYTHAPLPPPLPTPADLTVPASPSIAVQPYTSASTAGSHRSPGAPDAPSRRSTALPTGQTVPASSASSQSPASSGTPGATSYQYPPAPAPAPTSSAMPSSASAAPASSRRRTSTPASTSAPSVPTRRRITPPSADRPVSPTGWQDASSLPTTTSRRRTQTSTSAPEATTATRATRSSSRIQESAALEAESPSSSSLSRPTSCASRRPRADRPLPAVGGCPSRV